ncbi:MAG: methyltransferase domain-containing protein [Deltaproteobacteria bacterium]|nr:methyltransferase domain-containing protein [Deltaproteobacteria bacterium]
MSAEELRPDESDSEPDEPLRLTVGDRTLEFLRSKQPEARELVATRPYWSVVWPSTKALLEVLLAVPDLSGRRILDLGCGLGVLGLVAAARGADVVLGDIRPEAVASVKASAVRNRLDVKVVELDWNNPPDPLGPFDGILAADVFYEDGMLRGVLRFVRKHLSDDGIAWIADPNRVMPGGVDGAARLSGLECNASTLTQGRTFEGGVILYELWKRKHRLG